MKDNEPTDLSSRSVVDRLSAKLHGYIPALIAVAVAALIHFLFLNQDSAWGFFVYLMALLIAAWCGYGPGLLVLVLELAVLPYLYKPGFSIRELDRAGVVVLVLVSLFISRMSAGRKEAERLLREMNRELDRRLAEQREALLRETKEREQASAAHRASEEQFRSFMAHIPGVAFIKDGQGRYVFGNPPWKAQFPGQEHPEGKTDIELWPPEVAELFAASDQDVLTGQKPIQRMEQGAVGGKSRYWLVTKFLMRGPGDAPLIGGMAFDITENKLLESQLQQAQKMDAIGQLAGGVAHDFNNLLTVINGYSSLVLKRLDESDPLRTQVAQIRAAGDRAAALTQHLLAFSRKQVLQPKVLDLGAVIESMKPLLTRLIREDIEFVVALDPANPAVEVDPHQVEQVLMNLVINATDAMPKGGRITIETKATVLDEQFASQRAEVTPGRYVMMAVSDTGVGMDPELMARIFEPFFTTKPSGRGTGLGLSIVHGIVKQSGGHIGVYSEPGVGTTFRVYLRAAAAPSTEERTGRVAPALTGTESILLVEDDGQIRQYISTVLRELGYSVLTASGGEQALALGRNHPDGIDLLITDVVMPKMSGRDLAESLLRIRPTLRVLYISGYTENAIVHRGVLDPGLEFLAKPFSPEEIAEKVRNVLATPLRAKSVVVVDDEAPVRGVLSAYLRQAGYEVAEASSGDEAISICRQKSVNLLLTDLHMPHRDGTEVIQYFRQELPHIKIIAISGAFLDDVRENAENLGARMVLQKPIGPDQLVDAVKSVIG